MSESASIKILKKSIEDQKENLEMCNHHLERARETIAYQANAKKQIESIISDLEIAISLLKKRK